MQTETQLSPKPDPVDGFYAQGDFELLYPCPDGSYSDTFHLHQPLHKD